MQAEEGGGGQPHNHDRPPQPPPQKCPRCNSLNTKFCYYNNYSLTQPRYFCKGCRRYWTQGGTLRNVPVGGNSRKGTKRAKAVGSTSGNSSRPVIRPQPQVLLQQQKAVMMSAAGPAGLMSSHVAQYYPGGGAGYITSMPFTHSSSLNHQLGSAGNNSSSNNLSLLQGFNPISTFGQRQMQATAPTTQFYQIGVNKSTVEEPLPSLSSHLYPPSQHWANAPVSTSTALGATADESALWTTLIGSNTTTTIHASPNQWPDDLAGSFVDGGRPQ